MGADEPSLLPIISEEATMGGFLTATIQCVCHISQQPKGKAGLTIFFFNLGEIHIHKINYFQVYNSMEFSAFVVLFHHHLYLDPGHFIPVPEGNLTPFNSHPHPPVCPSGPWKPPICSLSPWICRIWTFCVSGIMQLRPLVSGFFLCAFSSPALL